MNIFEEITTAQMGAFALALLSLGTLYMPTLLLRGRKKLTKEALVDKYPSLAWIRWIYWPLYTACVLLLFGVCLVLIYALMRTVGQGVFHYTSLSLASAAVFDGAFAVLSGVRPVPSPGGYRFIYEDGTHAISVLQVLLGLLIVAVGLFLALL